MAHSDIYVCKGKERALVRALHPEDQKFLCEVMGLKNIEQELVLVRRFNNDRTQFWLCKPDDPILTETKGR